MSGCYIQPLVHTYNTDCHQEYPKCSSLNTRCQKVTPLLKCSWQR